MSIACRRGRLWLGEAFWGRGIVTEACVAGARVTPQQRPDQALRPPLCIQHRIMQLLEGRLRLRRSGAVEDGVIVDQFQYA